MVHQALVVAVERVCRLLEQQSLVLVSFAQILVELLDQLVLLSAMTLKGRHRSSRLYWIVYIRRVHDGL